MSRKLWFWGFAIHLLAAARLTGVPLWTLDKRLNEEAIKLGVAS
jgi:hypothetical protein